LSCVMPAYNEARNLPTVVPAVLAVLRTLARQVELIIVNDGSRDDTARVAAGLCQLHPEVVLRDLSRNFGKEAAMTAGLEAAQGDAIFLMDADGQHPVDLLPQMLAHWQQGLDVVYAVRRIRQEAPNWGVWAPQIPRLMYRALASGHAASLDAAVAYLSNAAGAADHLDAVRIRGLPCAIATQPYGVAKESTHKQLAERLRAAIETEESRERFRAEGFGWVGDKALGDKALGEKAVVRE